MKSTDGHPVKVWTPHSTTVCTAARLCIFVGMTVTRTRTYARHRAYTRLHADLPLPSPPFPVPNIPIHSPLPLPLPSAHTRPLQVRTVVSKHMDSFGDCLRELDDLGIIESDFILVSGTVSVLTSS
jgi:hypothetical protein